MTDMLLLIAALAAAYAGSAMIALANPAHRAAVTGAAVTGAGQRGGDRSRRGRIGSVLLALCVGIAVWRDGWGFGLLLGPLLIAVGLAMVIATLTLRAGWLRPLAVERSQDQ